MRTAWGHPAIAELIWVAVCAMPLHAAGTGYVGSKACAACHAEIYRKYSITPMALTSGPATAAPVPNGAFSANSNTQYTVTHESGKLSLVFGWESRELKYFVGSGAAARSYLIAIDNFLYEAPATYYNRTRAWAPSPGYEGYAYPFLTRAIAPACLACHATAVQPIEATQNGYQPEPFLEGGVGCERCHGAGAKHAASAKREDIINPASLAPEQRDSVCAQCHLSGEIRVDRAGKSMSNFRVGDKLSDYTATFVRGSASPGMKVTSHVENLAQSACSRASGARLWCGTCHDPHFVPSATEKVAWFRSKCQTCHATTDCQRGPNCIACHMPATSVRDADHVVYTDHSIPLRPVPRNQKSLANAPLVAFGNQTTRPRDEGLAYAIVALREQNATYSVRAFDLLREADRQNPNDPQTLSYLADLYKTRKDDKTAEQLYQWLLAADPTQSSAPMNLAAYQMERGQYGEAIRLFEDALKISPGLVLVRLDLAVALVHEGQKAEARAVLEKALEFNPSFTAARDLLSRIR